MENLIAYQPPSKSNWTGRSTDVEGEYWYQQIQLLQPDQLKSRVADFGLLGYACDEGVRRNQGRVGAKKGPESIRQRLGKLAFHHSKTIADFGDVLCGNGDMERTQETLSHLVRTLIEQEVFPIVLGGGHDVAYGHFNGIKSSFPDGRIGIVNFDAHFDLRRVNDLPSSGTPFYQILSENEDVDYLAMGIHPSSNVKSMFDFAAEYGVNFWTIEQCFQMTVDEIAEGLRSFMTRNDVIYITIDLDGFSSAFAPGVSAPSSIGLEPRFVMMILRMLLDSGKVVALDLAELNPSLDQDHMTADLAAKLIDFVVGLSD